MLRPARRRHRRLVPRRLGAAGRPRPRRPHRAVPLRPGQPARWSSWTPRRASSAGPPRGRTARWSWPGRPRRCRRSIRRADGPVVLSVADEEPPAAYPVEDRWVPGPGGDVHALLVRPAGAGAVRDGVPGARRPRGGRRRLLPRPAGRLRRRRLRGRARELPRLHRLRQRLARRAHRPARADRAGGRRRRLRRAGRRGRRRPGGARSSPAARGAASSPCSAWAPSRERWAAGIAEVPVADYLAAYEDEMEGLRAYDRALFGGSPEEVPDVYVRSSPLTYVDAGRRAGAGGGRRERPALPDPADRQLPRRAGPSSASRTRCTGSTPATARWSSRRRSARSRSPCPSRYDTCGRDHGGWRHVGESTPRRDHAASDAARRSGRR